MVNETFPKTRPGLLLSGARSQCFLGLVLASQHILVLWLQVLGVWGLVPAHCTRDQFWGPLLGRAMSTGACELGGSPSAVSGAVSLTSWRLGLTVVIPADWRV